jgi:hypothetical protein
MRRGAPIAAALLASALAALALSAAEENPASEGWRPFTATWSLSGERQSLSTEGLRPASIIHLSGPLTLTSGEGLGRGFLGEVIGFDDGGTLLVGRAAFVDEHGDKIFCTLKAQPIGSGRRVTATISGGTGRFAGLEGEFSLVWQYVVEQDNEQVSLRTANVEGRTRRGGGVPR